MRLLLLLALVGCGGSRSSTIVGHHDLHATLDAVDSTCTGAPAAYDVSIDITPECGWTFTENGAAHSADWTSIPQGDCGEYASWFEGTTSHSYALLSTPWSSVSRPGCSARYTLAPR